MSYIDNDNEYKKLVSHIISNKHFLKIDNCIHHGISRLDHSMRVSYYAYKVGKKLKLDYKMMATAGLLHDFYVTKEEDNRFLKVFVHPKEAKNNSIKHFNISEKEQNIIESHMFPLVVKKLPNSKESIMVSLVDKVVATYEFGKTFNTALKFKAHEVPIMMALIMSKINFY